MRFARIPTACRVGGVKCVNVEVINADISSHIMPSCSLAKGRAEDTVSIVFCPSRVCCKELLAILSREFQEAFKILGRDHGMASLAWVTVLHVEGRVAHPW